MGLVSWPRASQPIRMPRGSGRRERHPVHSPPNAWRRSSKAGGLRFLGSARTSCPPSRSGPVLVINSVICCSLPAYRSLTACSALAAGRSKFSRFQVMSENMLAPPRRPPDGGCPKPCIQPSQSDLLGPVNAYGRIVDVTPIQASSWQPAPAPASLPQQMAHSLPQRRSLTGSDLTVGPAAVDAKPTHSLPLAQGAAAPGHPSAPPPSRSATAAAFLGATPPTPSPVTTRGGGRPACQPCRITCRHRDPASARFHHGGTPPFGSGQDRQVQRMN